MTVRGSTRIWGSGDLGIWGIGWRTLLAPTFILRPAPAFLLRPERAEHTSPGHRPGERHPALKGRHIGAFLLALALTACGYHPPNTTLPGKVRSVRVVQPSPGKTGEPVLSSMLTSELVRFLRRQGIEAVTSGSAGAVLESKLLDLRLTSAIVSASRKRVTARGLRLRVECRLRDDSDETLWRSGLVTATRTWPLDHRSSATSEGGRRAVLTHLAADAARQCVELMMSGL